MLPFAIVIFSLQKQLLTVQLLQPQWVSYDTKQWPGNLHISLSIFLSFKSYSENMVFALDFQPFSGCLILTWWTPLIKLSCHSISQRRKQLPRDPLMETPTPGGSGSSKHLITHRKDTPTATTVRRYVP